MIAARFLRRLAGATDGAMAIETAIIAPLLVALSVGGFEASSMVARQTELQSAASEVINIVQAAPPETESERTAIRDILKASTGITDNAMVTVLPKYRCGTDADFVDSEATCNGAGKTVSTYVQIRLRDTYTPKWLAFGIDDGIDYDVIRTVQIS